MRATVFPDPEVGDEIEQVRASPGSELKGGAELDGILAAAPPSLPSTIPHTRRRKVNSTAPNTYGQAPTAGPVVQISQAHPGPGAQPPATATGPVTRSPATAAPGAPATVTSAAQRQATYSALVAAKLAEGFLLIANSCPVTRVPLLQSQTGQLLSVGTGKWFELAADGQLVEILEHPGAGPSSSEASPHPQVDPAIQTAQPGAQGVGPTQSPVGHDSIDPELRRRRATWSTRSWFWAWQSIG